MKKAFKRLLIGQPDPVSKLPSMTEPQQVPPLLDLIKHRNKGIPVPYFNGVFSETDTPDISKLDFIEIAELRERTSEGIELAKQDLQALNKQWETLTQRIPSSEEVKEEKPEVSPKTT